MKKEIFSKMVTYHELEDQAAVVATHLMNQLTDHPHFCLFLSGQLGTGKTTFCQYLLRQFGLSHQIPVASPTFTFVSSYDLEWGTIAHMDLYRLDGSHDIHTFSLDHSPVSGYLIEWPERLDAALTESLQLQNPFSLVMEHIDSPLTSPDKRKWQFSQSIS